VKNNKYPRRYVDQNADIIDMCWRAGEICCGGGDILYIARENAIYILHVHRSIGTWCAAYIEFIRLSIFARIVLLCRPISCVDRLEQENGEQIAFATTSPPKIICFHGIHPDGRTTSALSHSVWFVVSMSLLAFGLVSLMEFYISVGEG